MAQDLETLKQKRAKLAEQLKEVDDEIEDLKQLRRHQLLAELKELGYDGPKTTKASAAIRQRDPNKPCAVCEFVTAPPHDSRAHRSQGKTKKPFTADDLREKGMRKVS